MKKINLGTTDFERFNSLYQVEVECYCEQTVIPMDMNNFEFTNIRSFGEASVFKLINKQSGIPVLFLENAELIYSELTISLVRLLKCTHETEVFEQLTQTVGFMFTEDPIDIIGIYLEKYNGDIK
ncbi:hypothetical protein [Lysinibacillus sphaericus]|uniref:Uncharacterized protein n=1 Tax=Lysinibacillus sphaericus (strain C3-41) TaxID=444177 RepID=B1I0D9_LYSSC|nr:hypothetical protein [Lysinibacillus sphaericus]MBE5085692.1 hypothetical protein [Bacillus thuringiensis]ACA42298.1 hypothetical protein Bsph_p068 [Lysinibacillus sphaericus C3-41]AMO35441.1 hypothetical protein AR327_23405 [Lysinibacillus sphaericus]AMR93126.1 hypothetical protein A1T07_23250 [Lysinibacillus sphaericus]MBG9710692.1 hypothetical protein [Lysinibacillus sphaericus]